MSGAAGAIAALTLVLQGGAGSAAPPIHFTESAESGDLARTVTTTGGTPSTQVLEVKGTGILALDMDNDGDLDLLMPNGATLADTEHGPGAKLLRNDGHGVFTDVTKDSGISLTRWAFGGAVGDYDGDGLDDVYVCCFGPDVLLKNLGGGRFRDVSAEAGIKDDAWGAQAAFADLDGDGDLDLVPWHRLRAVRVVGEHGVATLSVFSVNYPVVRTHLELFFFVPSVKIEGLPRAFVFFRKF